ncbi:conjugal transfer protein [Vibrio sp. SS-MA-C1-2]|uniref:conjugal transfer protein n=1 Tax=Vibrio sp. SS-MA-C1-2 TaxID=2908646 RepID=UPI001F3DC7A1|nr:conjugal transfer protein [Vibrio sp. SS-MA-C1-2]UJF17244.1 conjugal transfer protein [Vibrio sp. SS-MA-C1-2]
MKIYQLFICSVISFSLTFFTPPVRASSDDCAIWLCLPMGFPSGCGDAKKAFKKRIKKLKPPLPNFFSCVSPDAPPSNMSSNYQQRVEYCREWNYSDNSNNQWCVDRVRIPAYVETFQDGEQLGERYYFDRDGNRVDKNYNLLD